MDWTSLLQRRRRPLVIIVVTLVLALVLEGGFYLGQHAAFTGMGAKPKNYKAMQAEMVVLQRALQSRDAELAIQRTRNEVDRQALELVRKEMAGQKDEISGLEEGLAFYRGLMAPDEIATGVSLRGIELMAGERPRQYLYHIVIQQDARDHDQLKGSLAVVIKGVKDGAPVEYPLAALSEDFKGEGGTLAFRYFQSLRGQLELPEGFEPGSIRVDARTNKPHEFVIGEDYPWQLTERFSHVGN